jgi:hypothetical protein
MATWSFSGIVVDKGSPSLHDETRLAAAPLADQQVRHTGDVNRGPVRGTTERRNTRES